MKCLVVYYSLEGNTKFIAETIAESTGADLLELKPKKDISSKGFMRYVKGGGQVVMKKRPELMAFDKDPNEYDFIYFGTPVWAASFAPSYNTFFSNINLKDKKVALFCCYRASCGNTFNHFAKYLEGNEIVDKIEFKEPVKRDENKKQIREWTKAISMNL
ncbi:flavodoxin family protein [Crassaminicella profunda]|uniref:flavodoxin family protein n=1 Tax=Crassaminicella profunda TaxID=1286698 RepID=UPI001CA7555D|nr:flavodoxin [Crassaminicella profunda]QZY55984.1 flavodoxin [Crassaminicella profunda]